MKDTTAAAPMYELGQAAIAHACAVLEGDATGHDAHHVRRVVRTAMRLAAAEGANLGVVEIIAALHDIADFKVTGDDMSGAREAKRWLLEHGAGADLAQTVASDIAGISFKGAGTPPTPLTLEGKCVQDADRLDALGAIGIARCFAYGGSRGRPIHDPEIPVIFHETTPEYLNHQGTSVNHFYEKLLLLKDQLHTDAAKAIAEHRHAFITAYLNRLYTEWDGTDFYAAVEVDGTDLALPPSP